MATSSAPLADYFWIAGIDSIVYDDAPQSSNTAFEETIIEDGEQEDLEPSAGPAPRSTSRSRHSRQGSANRFSRMSNDGRSSIHTLDELDGNTRSNRSSATIRPVHGLPNGNGATNGFTSDGVPLMGDFDFDKALVKFAAERENFLDDLSFTAGAKTQTRQPMITPRADRLRADENDTGRMSPIMRSIKGSIRRKISFREMSSVRKPPAPTRVSAPKRSCKFKESIEGCTYALQCWN
jgi:hypothetical protein